MEASFPVEIVGFGTSGDSCAVAPRFPVPNPLTKPIRNPARCLEPKNSTFGSAKATYKEGRGVRESNGGGGWERGRSGAADWLRRGRVLHTPRPSAALGAAPRRRGRGRGASEAGDAPRGAEGAWRRRRGGVASARTSLPRPRPSPRVARLRLRVFLPTGGSDLGRSVVARRSTRRCLGGERASARAVGRACSCAALAPRPSRASGGLKRACASWRASPGVSPVAARRAAPWRRTGPGSRCGRCSRG